MKKPINITKNAQPLFVRPSGIEMIREMSRKDLVPMEPDDDEPPVPRSLNYNPEGAFIIKPAANWLKRAGKQPAAQMLFGHFWSEGELCIMFADTNAGKSVLAVQIADSISRGRPIGDFEGSARPLKVLYVDFELSDRQFGKRYDAAGGNYRFSSRFFRAVANPDANGGRKFACYEDYIVNELENALLTAKAKVLIIDNITCLRFGTQNAQGALKLVRSLQIIKSRYKIAILVLAHTPKRNPARPINRNDLQGSKMLINFCDSAFAIGESQAVHGLRYLKQIKQRSSAEVYGPAGVCLCHITKPANFLQFEFTGTGHEAAHLADYTRQYRENIESRVAELSKQGHSMRQVAARLSIAGSTVCRILKKLEGREGMSP